MSTAYDPLDSALDRSECLRLLDSTPVGRIELGTAMTAAAHLVSYTRIDDTILIPLGEGARLAARGTPGVGTFGIDHLDPPRAGNWSVLVTGPVRVITPETVSIRPAVLPPQPWANGVTSYLQITCTIITGRRTWTQNLPQTRVEQSTRGAGLHGFLTSLRSRPGHPAARAEDRVPSGPRR